MVPSKAYLTAVEDTFIQGPTDPPPRVVKSNALRANISSGVAFKGWTYAQIAVRLNPTNNNFNIYSDIGASITLINRA